MLLNFLTKENRQDLERVQKAALRVILRGDYESYESALKISGIDSLEDRRKVMALEFARKCLNNDNYSERDSKHPPGCSSLLNIILPKF